VARSGARSGTDDAQKLRAFVFDEAEGIQVAILVVLEDVLGGAPRANVEDRNSAVVLESSCEDVDVNQKVLIYDTPDFVDFFSVALDD